MGCENGGVVGDLSSQRLILLFAILVHEHVILIQYFYSIMYFQYFAALNVFKIDLPFLRVLISRGDLFPQIRQLHLGELFKCADDSLESLHFPHYGVIGDLSMLKC